MLKTSLQQLLHLSYLLPLKPQQAAELVQVGFINQLLLLHTSSPIIT